MNSKFNIKAFPAWSIDILYFLLEIKHQSGAKIIENHKSFGMTREEMLKFLHSYLDYKEKLRKEVLPIYDQYPKLEIAFQLNQNKDDSTDKLVEAIAHIRATKYNSALTHGDKSKFVEEAILEVLRDSFVDLKDNIEIKSLSHLIELLENVDKPAGEKLQIISLYEHRHQFTLELEEFLNQTIPIFEAYFPIMADDFNDSLSQLEKMDNLSTVIDEMIPIKFTDVKESNINISIFPTNQLSISYTENILRYSIGIYFFKLDMLKKRYGSQEETLLSGLKALGDNTRLNMVSMLAKKPMYIQELAEALDLTPATISHHIDILIKNELVSISMDGEVSKRIYYGINRHKLKALAQSIEAIANDVEGGKKYGKTEQISIW